METIKPARRTDYELLRLLAIFCVVFNHTRYRGFTLYELPGSLVNVLSSMTLAVLCRVGVPLFLMISGGLLLHRTEPIRVVLRKRVLRIFLVLVLFSLVDYLYLLLNHWVAAPGIFDFLKTVWHDGISVPYWYLYSFLGLLLLLPLLRVLVQHMTDRMFLYLLALHVLAVGVAATVGFFTQWGPLNSDLGLCLTERVVFFFLMGYYFAHRFDWSRCTGKWLAAAWGATALAVGLTVTMLFLEREATGTHTYPMLDAWIVVPVLTIYGTVRQLCAWHPVGPRAAKIIGTLGSCTFGVYLLDSILRGLLDPVYVALEPKIHVLPACCIWVLSVVVCGLAATWVLKKIPGLRALL